jgi:hypothetical protein
VKLTLIRSATLRINLAGHTGAIREAMAPVSGFVPAAPGEPTLYLAGDRLTNVSVPEDGSSL